MTMTMKLRTLFPAAIAALLLAGCTQSHQNIGGAADNDQNVLTGGPITGITIQELPPAVKDALKHRAPHSEIATIEKTSRNGVTIYEFSFMSPGRNPKL